MKTWRFSILFMSFISLISNADFNPCNAIDISDINLQNVAIVFVDFELPQYPESKNKIPGSSKAEADAILNKINNSSRNHSNLSFMRRFFQCYAESSGIQIETLTFHSYRVVNNTCVLRENPTKLNDLDFAGKIVRIIESPAYFHYCKPKKHLDPIILGLVQDSQKYYRHQIAFCSHEKDCKKLKEKGLEPLLYSANHFYENWGSALVKLNSSSPRIFSKSEQEDSEYLYFTTVTNDQLNWASFMAVLTVITLFLFGLCACCCGLLVFALVEEDFRNRNEEREWMAVHGRREEYREYLPQGSPTLSNQDNMTTAVSKASNNSEPGVENKKSRTDSIISSSSSDIVTDKTQTSETISGTTHTAYSGETQLETGKESN